MKAILIPVDFSRSSDSAARYAIQLAKESGSRLVFFHAYMIPVLTQENYMGEEILTDLDRNSLKTLTEYTAALLGSLPETTQVEFHNEVGPGFIHNHIHDLVKKFSIELIVMGTKGQSGTLQKILLGSNAAQVLELSEIPVMIVPEKSAFKPIQKIVFATNLEPPVSNEIIEPLFELTWLHPLEIHFLVVIPPGMETYSDEQLQTYITLDKTFRHVPHFLEVIEDDNIVQAIHKYMDEIKADLLVTMPRKHNFLEKLFNQSVTREMIFQSDIPILCLKCSDR